MRFFARRLFLVGAVLAALALLMTPALASADDDDDDGDGGGDRAFCAPAGPPGPERCFSSGLTFDFDASSGPLGENPTGTFRFEGFAIGFLEGQVTCLQVVGNGAWVGGRITGGSPNFVGLGFAFMVLDNGPAGGDRLSSTTINLAGPPAANTPNCGSVFPLSSEVTGDIVVQDNIAGGGDDDEDDDEDDEDDDEGDDDDDDD